MTIYEKIRNRQMKLKAPKGQYNDFGKYSYRSCEDIFEALKPLLDENKLTLMMSDELCNIGERYYIKATACLYDTENETSIINIAYAREEETKKNFDGSQITGASSSYARKYALNGLFLIDDTKDSDFTNKGEDPTKEDAENYVITFGKYNGKLLSEVIKDNWYKNYLLNGNDDYIKKCIELLTGEKMPSQEEQQERLELINDLNGLVELTNTDYEKLLAHYKVDSNSDMTTEQLKEAIEKLKEKLV